MLFSSVTSCNNTYGRLRAGLLYSIVLNKRFRIQSGKKRLLNRRRVFRRGERRWSFNFNDLRDIITRIAEAGGRQSYFLLVMQRDALSHRAVDLLGRLFV